MTAEDHLNRADPVLGAIITQVVDATGGPLTTTPDQPSDHYAVLVRAIVSQNISTTSSRAIYQRLTDRFGGRPPSPEQILATDPDDLRVAAGLSKAKTVSLHSLAEHILDGRLELDRMHLLPDEEVVTQLSAVKGIGSWTAHIYLIFHLARPDILASGDLEIRRAVERLYALPAIPRPTDVDRIAEPWRPYRTIACLYLWHWWENLAVR
ncbi:hypothetical protein [Kribbella sp. NPDC051770]|uniref:DNA-3-methyladenine glycosylase family protein n=1 Tax=Kribbella sp. NPDC051770 TaxID=3155413 RepID=UPI00342B416B